MKYIKIDDDTFEIQETTETIKLSELRAQLEDLEVETTPPIDKELLDWARREHPYFGARAMNQSLASELKDKITKLETING